MGALGDEVSLGSNSVQTRAANDPSVFTIQSQRSVLNVKALVSAFNQEEALIGAFSVIVKTDGSFAALVQTGQWAVWAGSL